jgi:hypothetical protein
MAFKPLPKPISKIEICCLEFSLINVFNPDSIKTCLLSAIAP